MKRRNIFKRGLIGGAAVLVLASLVALLPLALPLSKADDSMVTVTTASCYDVGFAKSTEPNRLLLAWPMVHVGWDHHGRHCIGVIGIELNVTPRGERIEAASITLGGVNLARVGTGATFRADLLSPAMSYFWPKFGYGDIRDARPIGTIAEFKGDELKDGGVIVLEFPKELLPELERAVAHAIQPRGHPRWLLLIRLSLVSEGDHLLELTSGDRKPYHAVALCITWTSAPKPRPPTPTPTPPPQ